MGIPAEMKLASKVVIDGEPYIGTKADAQLKAVSKEINALKSTAYSAWEGLDSGSDHDSWWDHLGD